MGKTTYVLLLYWTTFGIPLLASNVIVLIAGFRLIIIICAQI